VASSLCKLQGARGKGQGGQIICFAWSDDQLRPFTLELNCLALQAKVISLYLCVGIILGGNDE